jgi:DNA repair exonuclease SbcCD nuclease subunit
MRILHAADLHLATVERDYSLAVLDEIIEIVALERVEILLLAGDVFDTYADAESLRDEVAARLDRLAAGCRPFYIPGNHEKLGATERRHIGLLSFGSRMTVTTEVSLVPISDEVELLLVPHRENYDDYQSWDVPPKMSRLRIAVAHGSVTGLSFLGLGDEEGGAIIDPDLFAFHGVNYAAMGHIHSGRIQHQSSGAVIAYPGSARVWRSGEAGERSVLLVDLSKGIEPVRLSLAAAGQWRSIELPLAQDGSVTPGPMLEVAGPRDWLEVTLTGVADDDFVRDTAARLVEQAATGRVRRLDIRKNEVMVLAGVSDEPVVRLFLDAWRSRFETASETDRAAWLRARSVGLAKIITVVGSRS